MIVTAWVCLGGGGGVMITIHSLKSTKKIYPGTELNLRIIIFTLKSPWKLTWRSSMVKVMYTLTFHRLLWSILNVCLPRKTNTIHKKSIWSFLIHLTLIFHLSKVTKTIFPQVIFYLKFPALFKSAIKNRGCHWRKGSYLHLALQIDLKVKIDGTIKCPSRSWSTFVRTILS